MLCECECGVTREVQLGNLTRGVSASCGCTNDYNRTHGESIEETTEYGIWKSMRGRCNNPKNRDYVRYGGRGVRVCAEWESFEVFLADVGRRPSPGYSLDRIDNNGNYEPGNVRWATREEQNNNTRRNRRVGFDGRLLTLKGWEVVTGIGRTTLFERLKAGWSVEKALTTPVRGVS